jgi:hypothetical protein
LLIVSDDGSANYADAYFAPAVATTGRSFAIWDRDLGTIETATLLDYAAVIWFSGDDGPGLSDADQARVGSYLGSGGKLLLSGQDMAHGTWAAGGNSWLRYVLHTDYEVYGYGDDSVDGVAGDPVSDGMTLSLGGGDGADNLYHPDKLFPYDANATQIFNYDAETGAGLRIASGDYRVIFLGFGFESIDDAADRALLMQRSLQWLAPADLTAADDRLPRATDLMPNAPNPFNPQTVIAFELAEAGPVQLAVYDLGGRLIRELTDGHQSAGIHRVVWDGRDRAGEPVASGTYVYRLVSADGTISRKMTVLK